MAHGLLAAYGRELRRRALGPPKDALDWAEAIAGVVFPLGFVWFALGRQRAMEEVVTTALYLSAAVLCGALFLVLRLGRAAFEIHRDDLSRIGLIERELDELKLLKMPRAELYFDPDDVRCAQPGQTIEQVQNAALPGKQYLYAIGIVNVSVMRITGCRLVLQASQPHHTSQQRLELPMRIRGEIAPDGRFDLNQSYGQPGVFIEVLEEWVPPYPEEPSRLRLTYASTDRTAHTFDLVEHILVFRLETDGAAQEFFLSARYEHSERRWRIQQTTKRPVPHKVALSRSRGA
jgi:hypothetical protein